VRQSLRTIDLRNLPGNGGGSAVQGSASSPLGHQQLLNSQVIAFLTLVNNEAQYATCLRYIDALQIPVGYSVEKIAVYGATSMAEGYQRAMESSTARYKLYVHQDVYLVHRGLLPELLRLFHMYPRLGMVGVVGATRLPTKAIWWMNNGFHSYGRLREYFRPGGFPASLYIRGRILHFSRFRSVVGDYQPAAVVDGLFMATQYDLPWVNSLGGFELYDHVQALEFIKSGLEVGIARQEATWCLHWGPPETRSREQLRLRDDDLFRRAALLRQKNPTYIHVPVRKLLWQHRHAFQSPDPSRQRLGVVIVASNGREVLLRLLRALLPQCDALKDVEYGVVVVGDASAGGLAEAVHQEFPHVIVMTHAVGGGPAHKCNVGLRQLEFPTYVLVMHDGVEVSAGALARMVQYLGEHPSTAGVVASLTDQNGTVLPQRMAVLDPVPRRPLRSQQVTFVGRNYTLVRGEVFFDIGLYDDRFHAACEDLDWSIRARRKGYAFSLIPEARVTALHGAGAHGRQRPNSGADRLVDKLWLVYKHGGRRWAGALYWVLRLQTLWLALRWRHDSEARARLNDAIGRMRILYRQFRNENRLPRPLLHETPES
jgi:GT2 family glycosyltransferase